MNTSPFLTRSHLSLNLAITIRQLRCIRPYINFKTASTIANSTVHSSLTTALSFTLYHNLPESQIIRLQQVKAPKSSYTSLILRSPHWLKITEHIECKLFSSCLPVCWPGAQHVHETITFLVVTLPNIHRFNFFSLTNLAIKLS